jgi:hypothetical protein
MNKNSLKRTFPMTFITHQYFVPSVLLGALLGAMTAAILILL